MIKWKEVAKFFAGVAANQTLTHGHQVVRKEFRISHVTVQVEEKDFSEGETHL